MCKETDIPVEETTEEEPIKTVVIDYKTVLKLGGTVIFGILCYKYGKRSAVKRIGTVARKNYRKGYFDGVADAIIEVYIAATKKGDTK